MKIIIYGAGEVGYCLAKYFSETGNSVIIIDEDAEKIENAHRNLDVEAIRGRGSYPDLLEKVGASTADILIAATEQDEFNMLACEVASSLFNIPTKIAYIRDVNYLRDAWSHMYHPNHMPIDHVISPEMDLAEFIANTLKVVGFKDLIPINETVSIMGVRCHEDSILVHKEIRELGALLPDFPFKVIYILREGHQFIPTMDDVILPMDEVMVVGKVALLKKLHVIANREFKGPDSILILGADNIGYNLIKELQSILPDVGLKIIEKDPENARAIADDFPKVIVLQGTSLDTTLLSEANAGQMDAVVAVMTDNESNILACLLAKSLGAQWTSALVSNSIYSTLLPSLGIDSVIRPQAIIISKVLRSIRKGTHFNSIYTLPETFDEICVGHVHENKDLVSKPVDVLGKSKNVLIGGIIRGGDFFIPTASDLIKAHDVIILMAAAREVDRLEKLF